MESKTTKLRHVVVFTFPFGSHPKPLFNLILKLAKAAPQVLFSFFNFPKSNESLLSEITKINVPRNFKAYPLDDGIPAGHSLSGNPLEAVELFLKSAPDSIRRSVDIAVAETGAAEVTCLITDGFLTFSGDIAQEFNASWIPVWLPAPCCLSTHFYSDTIRKLRCSIDISVDDCQSLDSIPGLSKMQFKDLPEEVVASHDGKESFLSYTINQISKASFQASAIVLNCFEELNPEPLNNDMRSKFRNYLNVGFLTMATEPQSDSSANDLFSWLDKQVPKSVAYISFGTIMAPPPHELAAVAEAIEATGIPFIWSLKDNLRHVLPTGFIERTVKQGKVVPWVPQTLVLAHNSLAVFITHFGWNSVCEGVFCGVPLIGRPLFADHRMIGRTVEEVWRIGVTVHGGEFSKNGLIKSLEIVMGSEEGKKLRENVEGCKEVVLQASRTNGSATKDFNNLVEIII